MSSLRPAERNLFENLFGMASGYVLDFTNNSFEQFFKDTVGIDIYSDKYDFRSGSKANRLRKFWEIEEDPIVGKVLSEMLDIWKYNQIGDKQTLEDPRYIECLTIVERLLGKESKEAPETQFLKQNFGDISISKIQLDSAVISVLEWRLEEANRCFQADSPLAVIFLCGSILEGILLGVALKNPQKFNQATSSPKDKTGKVKAFHEWTLSQFIDVAHELGLLKLDVKKFSYALRDFRNYIHPFQQVASKFQPDKHTAEICLQVLKAAIASLSGERN